MQGKIAPPVVAIGWRGTARLALNPLKVLRPATGVGIVVALLTISFLSLPLPAQQVNIGDSFFSPANLTIFQNQTVSWCWASDCAGATATGISHSTTSGTCSPSCTHIAQNGDPGWDSGATTKQSAFQHTFNNLGVFNYYCSVHLGAMVGTVTVIGPATHFQVTPFTSTTINAGQTVSFTVTALDANGRIRSDYNTNNLVAISSAGGASVVAGYVWGGGSTNVDVTFTKSGTQTVTIQDNNNGNQGSASGIVVNAGAATQFVVSGPSTAVTGTNVNYTVTAQDGFNNTAAGYAGMVHFSITGGTATLPGDSPLSSGVGTFGVTFTSTGGITLTAADSNNASINGTLPVTVFPPNCPSSPKTFPNSGTGPGISMSGPFFIFPFGFFPSSSSPNPSQITVSGMNGQVVGKVTVALTNYTAPATANIAFLLVGPGGQSLVLMSGAGNAAASGLNLIFDDAASGLAPQSAALTSTSYKPTDYSTPSFVSGSPTAFSEPRTVGTATLGSVFTGATANGPWSLYAVDSGFFDSSSIGGWTLTITPAYASPAGGAITINDIGPSTPYPSSVMMSGLPGDVANVSLLINGYSHTFPADVDVLLGDPNNHGLLAMSHAGGGGPGESNVNLILDDLAPGLLPTSNFGAGIYQPTAYAGATVTFPTPAPAFGTPSPVGSATFNSAFAGQSTGSNSFDPNGQWGLFVQDDAPVDSGSIAGWGLIIQCACPNSTSTIVHSSLTPSVFGTNVTFSADVTSSKGTPFGSIQFMDGVSNLGTPQTLDGFGHAALPPMSLSVGSHQITAVYAGNISFLTSTSPAVSQVVTRANSTTALGTSLTPTRHGQSVTFTATVTSSNGPTPVPSGFVNFTDNGSPLASNVAVNGSGVATTSTTTLTTGSHNIVATYLQSTNYLTSTSATLVQVVNAAVTTTALGTSGTPSVYKTNVTFTATVTTTAPGAGAPTGTVNFFDNGTLLGPINLIPGAGNSSTAMFSTSNLAGGSHPITAVFAGSTDFVTSSSGIVTQVVNKATLSNTLTSTADPSQYLHSVTFTAVLSSLGGAETGTLTLKDGTTVLAGPVAVPASHHIILTISSLAVGAHNIASVYSGDANFNGSTVTITPTPPGPTQVVNPENTTSVVTATVAAVPATSSTFGQAVTFAAMVSASVGTPTGTVQFLDNGSLIGSNTLDGSGNATFTTSALAVGNHPITVSYLTDGNFAASSSPGLSFDVAKAATTTSVSSSNLQQLFRHTVTFTAIVTSTGGTPAGTVQFMNNGGPIGAPVTLVSGQATLKVTLGIIGKHTIQAVYSGNASFSGSSSGILNQYRSPKPH